MKAIKTVLGMTLAGLAPAYAQQGGGLSDAETSFSGAVMLKGDIDVSFESFDEGRKGDANHDAYAYFVGNTLYAGTEDDHGNTLDSIMEFFWFESSIDRGSDFYVTVIKTRVTPNVSDWWYLMTGDEPVIDVLATTDLTTEVGGFRWDWSIPFENYGIDSYGEATLTNEYGLSAGAEGAVLYAETIDEDGMKAAANIQTKGYMNSQYTLRTQYQVTLYRWDVKVHGTPGQISWKMNLNTKDRTKESAYHEYFLVSQVKVDEPFVIEELDIASALDQWWWGNWDEIGLKLNALTLMRPEYEGNSEDPEPEDTGDIVVDDEEDDFGNEDEQDENIEPGLDSADADGDAWVNCSSTSGSGMAFWPLGFAAILLGRRRRTARN
jgi:MYXO-CTERM domain-containing protein